MRAIAFLVSLFVLSSVASAQITQEEAQPSKQGEQGWVQLTSPTSETIVRVRTQPNGDVWLSGTDGLFRSKDLGVNWTKHPDVGKCSISFFDSIHGAERSEADK